MNSQHVGLLCILLHRCSSCGQKSSKMRLHFIASCTDSLRSLIKRASEYYSHYNWPSLFITVHTNVHLVSYYIHLIYHDGSMQKTIKKLLYFVLNSFHSLYLYYNYNNCNSSVHSCHYILHSKDFIHENILTLEVIYVFLYNRGSVIKCINKIAVIFLHNKQSNVLDRIRKNIIISEYKASSNSSQYCQCMESSTLNKHAF